MNENHLNPFPRWLTMRQAIEYCPLYGEKHLITLVKNGTIRGGQLMDKGTRNWFIDKDSLDRYMESQCVDANLEQKIIDNFKRLV